MLYIITETDLGSYAEEMSEAFQISIKCVTPNDFDIGALATDDVVVNFFDTEPINLDLEQFGGYYPVSLKYVAITPICESIVHNNFSVTEISRVQSDLMKFIKSGEYVTSLLELHRKLKESVLLIRYAITHSNELNYIGDLCDIYNKFVLYDDLSSLKNHGSFDLSSEVVNNVIQLSDYVPKLYNLGKSKTFKES